MSKYDAIEMTKKLIRLDTSMHAESSASLARIHPRSHGAEMCICLVVRLCRQNTR